MTPARWLRPVAWRPGWRLQATAGHYTTGANWTLHVNETEPPYAGHVRTIPQGATVDVGAFYRWLVNTLKDIGTLEAARAVRIADVEVCAGGSVIDDRRMAHAIAEAAGTRFGDPAALAELAAAYPEPATPVTPITPLTETEPPLWQ